MSLISFICNFKSVCQCPREMMKKQSHIQKRKKGVQHGSVRESWTHLLPQTHRMYSYPWNNFLWIKKPQNWLTDSYAAGRGEETHIEAGATAAGKMPGVFHR